MSGEHASGGPNSGIEREATPPTGGDQRDDQVADDDEAGSLTRRTFLAASTAAVSAGLAPVVSADHDVDAIVSDMTLDEKTSMTVGLNEGPGIGHISGVSRVNVPDIDITDGPLGVIGATGTATSFPANLAVAAAFDRTLANEEGQAMALEAKDLDTDQIFAPAMNLGRTPVCGRLFDYYSGDPHHSGEIAAQVASGIQSQGIVSTVKHFVANNQDKSRQNRNELISERALRELYLPPFEKTLLDGGAGSAMAAYNRVNGTFCSEHSFLLQTILRDEWGWDGYVCSDYCAVHGTVDPANNGLDVSTGCAGQYFGDALTRAVEDGDVAESTVDEKVRRLLTQFKRTGHLDGAKIGDPAARNTTDHQTLSRQLAEDGSVLLKNQGVLPLDSSSMNSLAILGHQYDQALVSDSLSSDVDPPYQVAPSTAISDRAGSGTTVTLGDTAAAKSADVAIVYAGEEVSEGVDRGTIALPDGQDDLIAEVASANPNTVVVLRTPGPVEMPWLDDVAAVLEMWYPGMEDGNAAANLLFGDTNPSGKLPVTFGATFQDYPAHENPEYPGEMVDGVTTADYTEDVFVDYRWFDEQSISPLFEFGYGQSYTTFEYGNLQVSPTDAAFDDAISVSIDVTNTGSVAGAEVVQCYVEDVVASLPRPPRELRAFEKVSLDPGQTTTVSFELTRDDFTYWDPADSAWTAENGEFAIHVGASSRDLRANQSIQLSGGVDRTDGAPTRPSNLTLSQIEADAVELSWDGSSDNGYSGVDRYVVYADGDKATEVDAGTTTAVVDDLLPGRTYEFTVSAIDVRGHESDTSNTTSVTTANIQVPGRVQLELYDEGGAGTAYHDTTAGKEGPVTFRGMEDVDIESADGEIADYAIGWTDVDEWLEYTVDVAEAATYDLHLRYASGESGGDFHVAVDGTDVTGTVSVSGTGGWSSWETTSVGSVDLSAGEHVIRFYCETGGFNANWLAVRKQGRKLQGPYNGEAQQLPGTVQLQDYDVGGAGIAYHDGTDSNQGGAYRPDETVDLHETGDSSGDYHVGNTQDDEWLEYTIQATAATTYAISARVASAWGGAFHVEVDGEDVTGTVSFDATGGWSSWETVEAGEVDLEAGPHRIRLYIETGGFNCNWLRFETTGGFQQPYNGPHKLIDRLRLPAEDFDVGGQNAAYYDGTTTNQGGAYRPDEGVDIHQSDASTGYHVGNTQDDEWLEYTIEVVPDMSFDVSAVVASNWGSGYQGQFHVEVDGEDRTGSVTFADTGGWTTWETADAGTIDLAPGEHVIRFYVETGGFNLDRIDFDIDDSALPAQEPYEGTAQTLPGKIQTERYDTGGQYVGYYDTTESNQGNADFRTGEMVDVGQASDDVGQYNVGYTADDEWLEYTVSVDADGTYDIAARVASGWGDGYQGQFHVEVDGEDVGEAATVGPTGGWQTYTTVSAGQVELTAGEHVVRFVIETGGFNLNWIEFSLDQSQLPDPTPYEGSPQSIPGQILAERYDEGGQLVGYYDRSTTNQGGAFRPEEYVDVHATGDAADAYHVGNTQDDEWLRYTVSVEADGTYDLVARVASGWGGDYQGQFRVEVDGEDRTGSVTFPDTGGWSSWETVAAGQVDLTAGEHLVRFYVETGGFNLDWLAFQTADDTPSLAEVIDADDSGQIEDDEIEEAIDLWQSNDEVPGLEGEEIDDAEILDLIETWRSGEEV